MAIKRFRTASEYWTFKDYVPKYGINIDFFFPDRNSKSVLQLLETINCVFWRMA